MTCLRADTGRSEPIKTDQPVQTELFSISFSGSKQGRSGVLADIMMTSGAAMPLLQSFPSGNILSKIYL